jgi:hypothetical protein
MPGACFAKPPDYSIIIAKCHPHPLSAFAGKQIASAMNEAPELDWRAQTFL